MEPPLPFFRDAKFVGRDIILQSLDYGGVTILHGLSGTGKTHVVVEHTYRRREQRPEEPVMWLSSCGFWRLEQSIGMLRQGMLIKRSKLDGLTQFITWYTSQKLDRQRHLVLDDLSFHCFPNIEQRALVNFLNTFDSRLGRILVTTRVELPVLLEQGVDMSKMRLLDMATFSDDEADTFFSISLPEISLTEDKTSQIIRNLQASPAGLDLITAFGSHCIWVSGRKDDWDQLTSQISEDGTPKALELVLKAVVDHVANSNDKSYNILCCMSVLDTQGVPLPLLYVSWAEESPHHTLEIRRVLRKLLSLSLIKFSNEGYQCYMNEPIRKYLRERMLEDGTLASYHRSAIKDLDTMFAKVYQSMLLQTCEALIPHIQQVVKYETTDYEFQISQEALLCKLGTYMERKSKFHEAHKHFCDAVMICEKVYGVTNMRTMEVAERVAYTEMMMDKLDEAATIHEIIESVYAYTLSTDDWRLLMHSGAYGAVLLEQGKWAAAEIRLSQGIQGTIKQYGNNNKSGLIARNSLIRLYGLTGRYEKGRTQAEENLRLFLQDGLPKTHPNVIQAMANLGNMLAQLGRYKEAVEKHSEAVEQAELSSEVTPQRLFEARKELSVVLSNAGQIAAAAEQQEQLITLLPLIEPEPGETTINAHLNLGITLDRLSRFADAQPHVEKAFELCKNMPSTHPTLLRVRNCLALLYLRQGHPEKAESQLRDLLKVQMQRHVDNPAHPEVILIQNNLGGALQRQKKYAEAIEIQRDVLEKALTQPDISASRQVMFGRNNLAESLRLWAEGSPNGVEMLEEAESLHRQALEQREQQLGEVWQTWVSRINVGMVLQAQGKLEEARGWYIDLKKLIKAVGGANATVIMAEEKLRELERI